MACKVGIHKQVMVKLCVYRFDLINCSLTGDGQIVCVQFEFNKLLTYLNYIELTKLLSIAWDKKTTTART